MPSESTIDGIIAFAGRLKEIDLDALREGLTIAKLHRQLEQIIENDLASWGLTARQIEILEVLYHHREGVLTPAELSDEVGLTRSAMTGALDALEKLGHTVRTPHPTDRRMVSISLTLAGRDFISYHLPERYRKVNRIVSSMTQNERTLLLASYTKMITLLKSDAGEASK